MEVEKGQSNEKRWKLYHLTGCNIGYELMTDIHIDSEDEEKFKAHKFLACHIIMKQWKGEEYFDTPMALTSWCLS